MCLYEKTIENRRYKANKKNGGVIPAIFDERERYVTVGCGRCMEFIKFLPLQLVQNLVILVKTLEDFEKLPDYAVKDKIVFFNYAFKQEFVVTGRIS